MKFALAAVALVGAVAASPLPYVPAGGLGTNGTIPVYSPIGGMSGFDFQSLSLALHQEYIELDLFNYGLARFSAQDFTDAGLNAEDRELIRFMAQQEIGHAELISNMLGAYAPKQCQYRYYFNTVREFVAFCQELTRFGESGVYGFLEHLDSRPAAQMLLQSITTEARQQMIFRQFEGLFPFPVWFETGITQSMAWTLLAPYIISCPAQNGHLAWTNFPALNITNNPSQIDKAYGPAITHNRTALSYPGFKVELQWEAPGKLVGPDENGTYTTSTQASLSPPFFAAWTSQLNTTFTPITLTGNNTGYTIQPNATVFPDQPGNPIINGTSFLSIVDSTGPATGVTPFNLSMINSHIVAGPALYHSG